MPENILVVEYEPRYTDRVRQALSGQPFVPSFARDGEEAMRALENQAPKLIVLSSVVPKISTPELIRAIRGRKPLQDTPILLTVSGYNGKSPKADAQRMGASDILPKPYSESEFLGKIQQMLGLRGDAAGQHWSPELDPEFTARPSTMAGSDGHLTSTEIFGDLLEDDRPAQTVVTRKAMKPTDDVDKMLANTLAGMMPQKKKDAAAAAPTLPGNTPIPKPAPAPPPPPPQAPAADAKPKTQTGAFDKMLNDTLSGLEKNARPKPGAPAPPAAAPTPAPAAPRPTPVPPPAPTPAAAAPAAPAKPKYNTEKLQAITPEKVAVSAPILAPPPAPIPVEEEEPKDGIRFGQYVLLDKIATGGMAEVWKARMRGVEGFQKIVAIKKILPHLSDNQDFIEMFIDEAKLAAQLNHNNIIHIYDLGKIQASYYIAMEYIDGHDLKTILKRGEERDQPMHAELALFIASKIAAALDYAHRKHDFEGKEMGLVHRDVSPQNVLVSQDGDIKLCDFGIAKAASKASHTQAGALKGKLQYMSPEQAWGRTIDKRSDIFALATVLFEMLTNRKLFTGDNELSILEQVREARIAAPSQFNEDVTPQIDAIVMKALQKDPANRYQTAGEMARDLDAVLYTFRPTPTSADLAIYMHRIWSPEPAAPAMHEPEPVPVPVAVPPPPPPKPVTPPLIAHPPASAAAVPTFGAEEPKKKSPVALIVIAAIVLIAIGVGGWWMKSKSSTPAPATAPAVATQAPATVPTATTTATTASASTATIVPAAAPTTTTLDPSQVNAEVQKRLAAERARLDAQRAQQQPAPAAATPTRPAPAPTATQAAAAPPPTATTAPAPPPAVVVPPPPAPATVAETRPAAPEPAPAQPARAREGDLVNNADTPARMTKRGNVPYPNLARMQRVEGTVVMSVLVSETGQVLETRMLSGVNKAVGINEAAEQTVRRSSFSPGTKDGVKVKSWTTVRLDFKL